MLKSRRKINPRWVKLLRIYNSVLCTQIAYEKKSAHPGSMCVKLISHTGEGSNRADTCSVSGNPAGICVLETFVVSMLGIAPYLLLSGFARSSWELAAFWVGVVCIICGISLATLWQPVLRLAVQRVSMQVVMFFLYSRLMRAHPSHGERRTNSIDVELTS